VQLGQEQAAREVEMVAGRWDNQEDLRDALKLAIGDEYSSEYDQLKQRQEGERREMDGQYPHPPSLEDWWRSKGQAEKAEWWRYRETISDPPKQTVGEEVSNNRERKRSYGPSL
jgi:hypothetical protein